MNDKEILDRLWEEYRETPFASLMMQRKLDLRHKEIAATRNLIGDMADSREVKHGYRIKRVASTMFKLIPQAQRDGDTAKGLPQAQGDSDSLKGKPLIDEKESLTGEPESDCLSTDGGNHAHGQDDPFTAVPAELKALRQWVLWQEEQRDGKPTKIPYQVNRRKAQSNHQQTWTDYQTVCNHRDGFSGIGFVFSADDPYCGIDLDKCLDDTGRMKAWAKPIVDRLKSVGYGERSPGGHGIKFWTRAALGTEAKHKAYVVEGADAIEIYDQLRYFTVTGRGKGDIGDGQQVIDWLVKHYLSSDEKRTESQPTPRAPSQPALNTNEVISHIKASRQSAKFNALMAGNATGYGSQSEADLSLCAVVAFWSQEHAVIDAIFRQSALMRDKWDEKHRGDGATYGQMTIEEALSGKSETYQPKRKPYSPTRRRLHRTQQFYGGRR